MYHKLLGFLSRTSLGHVEYICLLISKKKALINKKIVSFQRVLHFFSYLLRFETEKSTSKFLISGELLTGIDFLM